LNIKNGKRKAIPGLEGSFTQLRLYLICVLTTHSPLSRICEGKFLHVYRFVLFWRNKLSHESSYFIAVLHILTVGIGFYAIWTRANALKKLNDVSGLNEVFKAGNFWAQGRGCT